MKKESLISHDDEECSDNGDACSFFSDTLQVASPEAAACLRQGLAGITTAWIRVARDQMTVAQRAADTARSRRWLPEVLENLADALEAPQWRFGEERNMECARAHGRQRRNAGLYTVDAVIYEYAIFRSVVCDELHRAGPFPAAITARVHNFFDAAMGSATSAFMTAHRQESASQAVYEAGRRDGEMAAAREASRTARLQRERSVCEFEASLREVAQLLSDKQSHDHCLALFGHDLRSPLTALAMRTQLLEMCLNDADLVRRTVPRLLTAIKHIDSIIQDTLDARRVRAGHSMPVCLNACDVVHVATAAYERYAAQYGSRIRLQVPEVARGTWDSQALRRVIDNLVDNAVKFGDDNGEITIAVTDTEQTMRLSVRNFGCTMAQSHIEALLGPYRNARSGLQEGEHQGCGIGLTLVRGITEMHGGKLGASSDAVNGTLFWCDYPKETKQQLLRFCAQGG